MRQVNLRRSKTTSIKMMPLSLQNESKIGHDKKTCGDWLIRTSSSSRSQVSESSPKGTLDCLLLKRRSSKQSLRDGEWKFAMTIVNRKTEPVTRQAVLVISFTPTLTVKSVNRRQMWKVLYEQDLRHATKLNMSNDRTA